MAVMDALLRIKADVQGEGQVAALGRTMGGLSKTAGTVSGGFKNLAGSLGSVVGGMGSLVPLLSGAGLVGLAQKSIETGDKLFDMSQKTGVAVEQLSRFSKAGKLTGIDIDSIGKAITKFNRALFEGKADEALKSLGISATDASGKLRATDEVMLDIADRFSKMPDGAQKTALAMQLFGKAGADMIPMLNMGRQEIEKFSGMSAKFAEQADKTSDSMIAMQGKIGAIGGKVATVLMPAMEAVTNAMTVALDAFMKMPAPLQTIIGTIAILSIAMLALAPAISAVITLIGAMGTAFAGLKIGATIAGYAPAIIGAFSTVLAWLTGTFLPGLLAIFTGPVGLTVLAVAAIIAMAIAFREPILKFLTWLGETFTGAVVAIGKGVYDLFLKPWVELFNVAARAPITGMIDWLKATWAKAVNFIGTALSNMANAARAPFLAVVETIRGAINGVLRFIAGGINAAVRAINVLIAGYNRLPTPDIPLIPQISVPQFAEGGVVDRPTLAMVGEGGEREYIIPESKMAGASAAYLAGTRGAGVITGTAGPAVINITTGPVLQQDGQQWVTTRDLERAMRATEAGTLARIRTPAGRSALGIR